MPKKTPATKGTAAPAKKGDKKSKITSPLFEARKRNFGIGNSIQPKRDLWRFVKWPKYIQLQRQRRILYKRLKVPPTLNQFTRALDKSTAGQLFKLLHKYRPETAKQRKERLLKAAQEAKDKKDAKPAERPVSVVFGLNEVTSVIESKQAKLVVIAHDVDPIELVVWLPTLCRKMDVPYCIVKSKSRLGAVVDQHTVSVVAFTNVNKEDKKDFDNLVQHSLDHFNKNADLRKQWGGLQLGSKAAAQKRKLERAVAKEKRAQQKL